MAARRLILAMIVLLVASSVAAALVPVERRIGLSSTETTTTDDSGPTGKLVTATMRAGAAHPQTVSIRLGDQLSLQVTSLVSDQVEIPALGELADVDRDAPARFDLLPFETGRYSVRLVDAKQKVGRIVVRARKRSGQRSDQGGDSSSDSPGSSTAARTSGALSAS